ncbi:MAG: hypothetical protein NUW24_17310 [Anaerolineae bacterium]|jgi:hypothetical protein|nr:hypothetical protein [Anaerolineae bacterium]
MVLTRNNQPLAAMQYQGRLLHTWSEMIYAGRGYRLSLIKGQPDKYILADEDGNELLTAIAGDPLRVQLNRALPLTILIMAVMRIVDELSSTAAIL